MNAEASLDALFEPLSRCFGLESARRIVDFKIPPSVQERDLCAR
jgi:hypothetical protein